MPPTRRPLAPLSRPPLHAGAMGLGAALMLILAVAANLLAPAPAMAAVPAATESQSPAPIASAPLIARIQKALARQGLYKGPADGLMTPATIKAIKTFQRQLDLAPDGLATDKLARQMETDGRVGDLLKRMETAREERIREAREALLSRPETRALAKHIDDVADPTRDAAPCFRQPTPRCLLREAMESAKAVYKPEMRDWALGEVLVSQAKAGLAADAMQTVRRIRDPRLIMAALRNIAEAQARAGRIDDALEAANIIPGTAAKAEALGAIAGIEVGMTGASPLILKRFDRLIGKIEDRQKQIALGTRAAVIFWRAGSEKNADKRMAAALVRAKALTDETDRNVSLGHVAVGYAEMGRPAMAVNVMQGVGDVDSHGPVLISAATAQAEAGALSEALTLAENIDAVRYRAVVLGRIAIAQAEAGNEQAATATLERAIDEIAAIRFPYARDYATSRISMAMRDIAVIIRNGKQSALFERAVSMAGQIKDNQLRARLLWSIAADRTRAGDRTGAPLTRALAERATETIKSPLSRIWMFGDIAFEHAERGEMDAALESFKTGLTIAEGFENAWGRARALGKLAQALSRITEGPVQLSARP